MRHSKRSENVKLTLECASQPLTFCRWHWEWFLEQSVRVGVFYAGGWGRTHDEDEASSRRLGTVSHVLQMAGGCRMFWQHSHG